MKLKDLIEKRIKELEEQLKDDKLLASTKRKLKEALEKNKELLQSK